MNTYTYAYIRTCVCMCVHMHIYIYICMCKYAFISLVIRTPVCEHIAQPFQKKNMLSHIYLILVCLRYTCSRTSHRIMCHALPIQFNCHISKRYYVEI